MQEILRKSRHGKDCIACGSPDLIREWSIVSSFFALRALLTKPFVVPFMTCRACGTSYFDLAVTEEELARLYDDYRGETYLQQRSRFEPSYTRAFNESLGAEDGMDARRAVLAEALSEAGEAREFGAVLDHGGDRGQMLRDLPARRKTVLEISGVKTDPGNEPIDAPAAAAQAWDLILSCHVLEHLTFPMDYVREIVALGRPGTAYFIEVPYEPVPGNFFNRTVFQHLWLWLLVKWPWLLMKFDMASGHFLWKKGFVMPLMFYALREHLTFFSVEGVQALLRRGGLEIVSAKRGVTGHIVVVARKN